MTTPGGAGTFWKEYIPCARCAGYFRVRLVDPGDGPLGEHPGWNGVALPGCREPDTAASCHHDPGAARSRLALAPFFMEAGGLVPSVLVAGLVTTMAVTFWYAWLFNHTAGSVLLVVVAHSVPLGGHRTLGWAAAPTAATEEGRRRTLKAIHAPLITTNADRWAVLMACKVDGMVSRLFHERRRGRGISDVRPPST
jgi:hypothetical protein